MKVISEDDPNNTILNVSYGHKGFQKQQGTGESLQLWSQQLTILTDTLIIWTNEKGVDMALSFEHPEDCAEIW